MSRTLRIALNWTATIAVWLASPLGGLSAAITLWLSFWWIVGMLNGGVNPRPEAYGILLGYGVIAAAWIAAVWIVLFLHRNVPSRLIHFVGCNAFAIPAALMAPLAVSAMG